MIDHVCQVSPTVDLKYPRFLASHPRNAGVDFGALDRYVQAGRAGDPADFELFLQAPGKVDAVWVPGVPGPIVSPPLREALSSASGEDLRFLPVTVNGGPYWILQAVTVIDALDQERTDFELSPDGEPWSIDRPVWITGRLRDPSVFTVPRFPTTIWATPGVADAYRRSGCDGLNFAPRGEVV